MTDQFDTPAPQPGDLTVPLVPADGYSQPDVPPLETTTWPDFSYDDPYSSTATLASAPAPTAPLPTTPLPYSNPQPGAAYPQPGAAYQQPGVAYQQPAPPYQPQPAYQPQAPYPAPLPAEPAMYETYRPQPAPVPAVYSYPSAAPLATAPEHPNAVVSLVLGIAGLLVVPFVLSPIAWIVASRARRQIAQYPGRWTSGGTLTVGYVLGIIGTLLWGALAAMVVFLVVLAASFG